MGKSEKAIAIVFVVGLLLVILRSMVPEEVVVAPVVEADTFREWVGEEEVLVESEPVLIPQEVTIEIIDLRFVPDEIVIAPGTTVIWKNLDSSPHKPVEYTRYFYGSRLGKGDTFSYTFEEIGEYRYFDANFPKIGRGKITVQNEPLPITGNVILMGYDEENGKSGLIVVLALISALALCSYIKKSEKR